MNAVIRAEGIERKFGAVTALSGVDLEIEERDIYGLVGPNGAGKSTLTRILCGLLKPSSGKATVLGHDVVDAGDRIRQHVGYMSQQFALYPDLSTHENLLFFSRVHGLRGDAQRARIDAAVAVTGLESFLDKPAAVLSGGWKQRLSLACAIMHQPLVLFLDEPTAGIDPVARRALWDLLFDMSSNGTTIFVTTQYMDEVERCTHVGYVYASRMMVSGTPAELKLHPSVSSPDYRRYAIETLRPTVFLRWLRAQSYCRSVTMMGNAINAELSVELDPRSLVEMFAFAGFPNSVMREVPPTLEDLFVALTERFSRRD